MSNILKDTMNAANHGYKTAKEGTMHALDTAKDELDSAKDTTMHALGTAKHEAEAAKQGTLHAISSGLATVLTGVSTAAGIITALKKLDRDDGLAWLGLPRRRSPLLTIAILGASAAVGAGIALWFAPMSGADLRTAIFGSKSDDAKRHLEIKDEPGAAKAKPASQAHEPAAAQAKSPEPAPQNGRPSVV